MKFVCLPSLKEGRTDILSSLKICTLDDICLVRLNYARVVSLILISLKMSLKVNPTLYWWDDFEIKSCLMKCRCSKIVQLIHTRFLLTKFVAFLLTNFVAV